jgi:hypothetical protein
MRRQIVILSCLILIALPGTGAEFNPPRSVGVNLQIPDMQQGPIPWWHLTTGQPLWQSLEMMVENEVTAVGLMLRAHPWDHTQNFENIRKALRTPGIDILVIRFYFWASTDNNCRGTENLLWGNYPTGDPAWEDRVCGSLRPDRKAECLDRHGSIFKKLYQYFGNQDKDIFVIPNETGWQMFGVGCRERNECPSPPNWWCIEACENGTLVPYPITAENPPDLPCDCPDPQSIGCTISPAVCEECREECKKIPCEIQCCDMLKVDRGEYLLKVFNERQKAAEEARAAYPNAKLRVWNTVEAVFFGTRDWQFITPLKDIIPRMDSGPDAIGASLWPMSDDVLPPESTAKAYAETKEIAWPTKMDFIGTKKAMRKSTNSALDYILEHTGLPPERVFISEVGTRERQKGDQRKRIEAVVNSMFERRVAFALIWSWEDENLNSYISGRSIVDEKTGEPRSGYHAMKDLNKKWRVE